MLAGIPDPVDTGEIVFDIYDVDLDNTGGTVDMMTGEFSSVTTILQRDRLEESRQNCCSD